MAKTLLLWGILFTLGVCPLCAQDKLMELLREELQQYLKELSKEEFTPYYMNFRVTDKQISHIATSFGVVKEMNAGRSRVFVPHIRIGTFQFDNFRTDPMEMSMFRENGIQIPLEDEGGEDAIRQAIWKETNACYNKSIRVFRSNLVQQNVKVDEEDQAPSFSAAPVEKYYEVPLSVTQRTLDVEKWTAFLKKISAVFGEYPDMLEGDASIDYVIERRYFINSEGTKIAQNFTYTRIIVAAMVKATDGMVLPLQLSYFAYLPEDLPQNVQIVADVRKMAETLVALQHAPVAGPYTGPALLSGAASGVFFHEIFGHRVEGQRMKSDNDGQTFKKMQGQLVLPADMQVYDDPTLREYAGTDLNGYYQYDDEGVRARRVDVVVDGKLKDFLMTRTPIDNQLVSNGHARAERGFDPASRQSNLVVETKKHKTSAELKKLLREEAEKQGKEYGYFFKEVSGGLTYTGKKGINSFQVNPLEVYRVYVDGRPDELVRGVSLIGTPLSMFSNILYAGGETEVFTGICGAESGMIPVAAISPALLVSKIETQCKAKSKDTLPVLPSPVLK